MAGVYDEWGIANGYHDVSGAWHDTSAATREFLRAQMGEPPAASPIWFIDEGSQHWLQSRCRLTLEDGTDWGEHDGIPGNLPIGYHHLQPLDGGPDTTLVVAPTRCPEPPRGWGVAAQVYALWRPDAWGIGDLRDVARLGQLVAAAGGRTLLLSPLHAPGPTTPQEASPYFPSSRRWLNPLLIPIDSERPGALDNSAGGLIQRDRVWPAKRQALSQRFAAEGAGADSDWRNWARAEGPDLWRFCTWNALADRHGQCWREWPEALRHPDSPAVHDLPVHDHQFARDCEFHAWVQWVAHSELLRTSAAAGVQLIGDLAVGCTPFGADAWLYQDQMALDVSVGAPPDPFNAEGQSWGLPPFVPARLRAVRYAPIIAMIRAACRGMGGLRIDHVMGLFRQFWIPATGTPADGAYVQLPADEMLAIVRLEATRAGTFVVGEDLGTVQPEVREAMRSGGVLGTKVFWFDTETSAWPQPNLATVTTHDLPTVAGVWAGTDGSQEMAAALHAAAPADDAFAASVALHAKVAASDAVLCLAALDDLAGCTERPNHPGTIFEKPNWCLRMPATSEAIMAGEPGRSIVAAICDR
ncbi:MAG: 4-alpha-glucanotransferase [Actinomycetota bacterium]|nr:4-alpha-glucanotransferase [Actinomycetota bacterium]